MIEKDEDYFTIKDSKQVCKVQKIERGSKINPNVMLLAENTVLEDLETGKVDGQCRYFKS
ncbi:hypothetical protein PL373_00795 [Tenacibaculum maritimum]|nr:hypothetical protein [Tenacibaculum maritimum]